MKVDLRKGDCIEILKSLPDNSVDSIVTDPPYGLGFMGKEWDTFDNSQFGKQDRNEGLEDFEEKRIDDSRKEGNPGGDNLRNRGVLKKKNFHPTVKPTDLMRYLVKLVTPKGGIVLDPFMGSGSTGRGCKLEDFNFIGIELDEEYFKIAEVRINKFDINKWNNQWVEEEDQEGLDKWF